MNNFNVNAESEELNALIHILDEAVKAKGLPLALVSGFWERKIKDAAEADHKERIAKASEAKEPPKEPPKSEPIQSPRYMEEEDDGA